MASYITRTERSGSIFFRITGLIRSGQMAWADRPLWYDVYAAMPPLTPPEWNVKLPKYDDPVKPIFYAEDNLRAEFYKRFKRGGVFNMASETDSVCHQFVREYEAQRTENPTLSHNELFTAATKKLEENGIDLGGKS